MADRTRIEKLVGMLGSEHAGEVFNAAQMLVKIAKEEKKTLVELLMPKNEFTQTGGFGYPKNNWGTKWGGPKHYDAEYTTVRDHAPFGVEKGHFELVTRLHVLLDTYSHILTEWEKEFIDGLYANLIEYGSLTGKQVQRGKEILKKAIRKGVSV